MDFNTAKKIMFPDEKRAENLSINPYLYLLRFVSFRFSYLLYKFKISANMITVFSFVSLCLVSTIVCLNTEFDLAIIIFGLWANFYYYLDVVDGNVARLSQQNNTLGKFLDETADLFANVIISLVLGYFYFSKYDHLSILFIYFGIIIFRILRRSLVDYWSKHLAELNSKTNIADFVNLNFLKFIGLVVNTIYIPNILIVIFIEYFLESVVPILTLGIIYLLYNMFVFVFTLHTILKLLRK